MNQINRLSETIVNYSLNIKENDRVLITSVTDKPATLIKSLIQEIVKNKGIPFVTFINPSIEALLLENTSEKRIEELKIHEDQKVNNFDCFIHIRYTTNEFENIIVNPDIIKNRAIATKQSDYIRVNERRWVLLNYPSELDAYKARQNTDEFYRFALEVMNVDYSKMKKDIEPLVELMKKTNQVRILSPDTDLTFSIKDIPVVPCCGECNIPDGEVYTAPVKNSVNGIITYNVPSVYQGNTYDKIQLTFENGKIIKATSSNDVDQLNKIFDTDEGSRYVGEFSFGLNPKILHPMGDILYDEKIIGSIHFTPGAAYKDAYNGNDSAVHWDLVLIQRKEYGGGEIYFDHTLIRKDGIFTLPSLQHLNYLSK